MKTFNDLVFKEYVPNNIRYALHKQAVEYFDNGYGISVLLGARFYSNGIDRYEVALLFDGEVSYNSLIDTGVKGWQSRNQINKLMKKIQQL